MKALEQQVVHESETQRQHIRLKMPSRIEVQGQLYPVRDLSSGGAGAEGVATPLPEGVEVPVRLYLPFDGYSLDVELTARVRHYSRDNKVLGLQFTNLTPDRVAILTYIVKAYIAGDVVEAGDILSVTARDNFVKMRKKKEEIVADNSLRFLAKQYAGTGIISLIGAIVAFLVLTSLYESMFLVKSTDGAVQGGLVTLRMPQSGEYKSLIEKDVTHVKAGQPLAAITVAQTPTTSGGTVTVDSPCNCIVARVGAMTGEYREQGSQIFTLIPEDTKPWVTASVPMSEIHKLQINDKATIRVAGTDLELTGKVTQIGSSIGPFDAPASAVQQQMQMLAQPVASVTIMPDQKIQLEYIGRPAYVEFKL